MAEDWSAVAKAIKSRSRDLNLRQADRIDGLTTDVASLLNQANK